jgi:tryptophan synthase beta chain
MQNKILLTEDQIPTQWYNIIPDLPSPPPPPLHPGTMQPVGPDDLAPLFPMALIMQEVTQDSYVDIPGGVLDVYRLWRPSPLSRWSPWVSGTSSFATREKLSTRISLVKVTLR